MCRLYHNTHGWYVRCCYASRFGRGTKVPINPATTHWDSHDAASINKGIQEIVETGTVGRIKPGKERGT